MAGHEDFMQADMWSLGLVTHTMLNPNLGRPHRTELAEISAVDPQMALRNIMAKRQLLQHSSKHEQLRVSTCWQLEDIFVSCAEFILKAIHRTVALLYMQELGIL